MSAEQIASLTSSVDFTPYISGLVAIFGALAIFYVASKAGSMVIKKIGR